MSFSTTFDFTTYINRAVAMLDANSILRNTGTPADSLISKVLAQEPPIEVSPNKTVIPSIYVYMSRNAIRESRNFGRDSLDSAGAKYYHLEWYNVCIDRGRDRQTAQQKAQVIATIVRDVYQKNLRMTDPAVPGTDPKIATNNVISVPYVLRTSDPNIQAINVICRAEVPISLR